MNLFCHEKQLSNTNKYFRLTGESSFALEKFAENLEKFQGNKNHFVLEKNTFKLTLIDNLEKFHLLLKSFQKILKSFQTI